MPFKLKDKAALHIPVGVFFYQDEVYEDVPKPFQKYFYTVEQGENMTGEGNDIDSEDNKHDQKGENLDLKYTRAELKKMNVSELESIIMAQGGDVESVSNQDQRIELILTLQEEGE